MLLVCKRGRYQFNGCTSLRWNTFNKLSTRRQYNEKLRDGSRMNFRKSSRGGGSFSIQKFILQILDLYRAFFRTFSEKNCNTFFFQKWGGGGRRLEFFRKFTRFGSVTRPNQVLQICKSYKKLMVWLAPTNIGREKKRWTVLLGRNYWFSAFEGKKPDFRAKQICDETIPSLVWGGEKKRYSFFFKCHLRHKNENIFCIIDMNLKNDH